MNAARSFPHCCAFIRALLLLVIAFPFACLTSASAQSANGATVRGTVSNGATRANLQGVRIQIDGGAEVLTAHDGSYEITGLASGTHTLVLTYPGLDTSTVKLDLGPAEVTRRDVDLSSAVYMMSQLTVAGEREGNAAAIVAQRNAVNVQNVVTADAFGSMAKGNVGNFLRRLPGIAGTSDEIDTENVILRGMASEFTSLDIDGTRYAGFGGTGSRTQSALGMPADLIERIEVVKSPTPDTPADSLGGRINMVTKSAYDRQGRQIQARFADSYSLTYGRAVGRHRTSSFAPSIGASYSDVYSVADGHNNLGVYWSANWERILDVRGTTSWDSFSGTPAVPRFNNGSIALHGVDRGATQLKVDYKYSDKFQFGGSAGYNMSTNVMYRTRAQIKNGTVRSALSNPDYSFTVVDGANYGDERSDRDRWANRLSARTWAKYRTDAGWRFEGDLSAQRTTQRDFTNFWNATSNRKFNYALDRRESAGADPRWPAIRMLTGFYTGNTTTTTVVPSTFVDLNPFSDDFRDTNTTSGLQFQQIWSKNEIVNAKVDAIKKLTLGVPIEFKTGASFRLEGAKSSRNDLRGQINLAASGFGPDLRSLNDPTWDLGGAIGRYPVGIAQDISKVMQAMDIYFIGDNNDPAQEWHYNPAKFSIDTSGTRQNTLQNRRKIWERVSSAYVQGTANFGRLNVLTGVRIEHTASTREQVSRNRKATGTLAEWTDRDWGTASYDNVFPSIHTRYSFAKNLILHASFGTTAGRPNWGNIIGVEDVDDSGHTVTVPNLDLKPRTAKNYDLSLEYYFEPVGVFSVGVFEKRIADYDVSLKVPITLAEARDLGAQPDPTYTGLYTLSTRFNAGTGLVRGLELNYSQSLSFLPGAFRGLGVFANFTYNKTEGTFSNLDPSGNAPATTATRRLQGFIPRTANAGLNYVYGRFDVRPSWNFTDDWPEDTPTDPTTTKIRGSRWSIDCSAKYRATRKLTLFLDLVNITTNHGKKYRGSPEPLRRNETNALGFLATGGVLMNF
jgi:iron complex outermembrane receptor protein